MIFSLYELALQPEIQEKLRNEIKTTLAKTDGEITYEAVFGMEYLGHVIDGKKYANCSQFSFRFCSTVQLYHISRVRLTPMSHATSCLQAFSKYFSSFSHTMLYKPNGTIFFQKP